MAKRKRSVRQGKGSTEAGDTIIDQQGKKWFVVDDCSIQLFVEDDTGRQKWFFKKDVKLSA